MRIHMETLFEVDASGCLLCGNELHRPAAPRFFLGRTPDGDVWAVRHDLPRHLADELVALAESMPRGFDTERAPERFTPFVELVATGGAAERIWAGPVYAFAEPPLAVEHALQVTPDNASVLSPHLEEWREDVSDSVPMAVDLEGGEAVSLCCSVRISDRAHEAGVETHPRFRGQGRAARVVVAWAGLVRAAGRIPLYSTSWDNEASRRLAARVGLGQYGSTLHIA